MPYTLPGPLPAGAYVLRIGTLHGVSATVVIRADGDPARLAAAIRQTVKSVDPTVPVVGLRTLEEFRRNTPVLAERALQMYLTGVFAAIALTLSAIGVYGASAYATEARRREFGIRLALGASQTHVLRLALQDAARVTAVGAIVGIPAAVVTASLLRERLYSVTPFDPLTLSVVFATLILVVLGASFVPARRAVLIDPARTMKTD